MPASKNHNVPLFKSVSAFTGNTGLFITFPFLGSQSARLTPITAMNLSLSLILSSSSLKEACQQLLHHHYLQRGAKYYQGDVKASATHLSHNIRVYCSPATPRMLQRRPLSITSFDYVGSRYSFSTACISSASFWCIDPHFSAR